MPPKPCAAPPPTAPSKDMEALKTTFSSIIGNKGDWADSKLC